MPRTSLPEPRRTPRFAGVPTFCRFPLLEHVAPEHLPVDWALYGVPFDTGVTYRPGARFGPRAIRNESQYVKPYHVEYDMLLTDVLSLADAGDAPVAPYDCRTNIDLVTAHAKSLGDPKHTRLFAVGGDHSIALANMRAAYARHGSGRPMAVLHFDSHLDTVDRVFDEQYGHASPFIRAIEEGLIDPARMLSIGIKGPLNSPDDREFARRRGVTIVTYPQWREESTARIDPFLDSIRNDPVYLSFDIDVIDPAFAPGTGTPSVGGFTSAEMLGLLRHIGRRTSGLHLAGADLVEVLPDRDVAGITALLAGQVLFEVLCLDALRCRRV